MLKNLSYPTSVPMGRKRKPAIDPLTRGHPTASKFTPERCARLITLRRELVPLVHCLDAVGITHATMENWRRREEPEYVAFFEELARAEAEAIAENMVVIRAAAARGNWQAAAWQLERLFPDEFGQRRDFQPDQLAVIIQHLLVSLRALIPDVRERRALALALKGEIVDAVRSETPGPTPSS